MPQAAPFVASAPASLAMPGVRAFGDAGIRACDNAFPNMTPTGSPARSHGRR